MVLPTASELRSWAPPAFDWTTYGFPDPAGNTALEVRIGWAAGQLFAVTGRTMESITSVEETAIAQKVVAAFTVTEAMGGGAAALAVLEQPWLKSFTAGSYSETRFSPQELAGGQAQAPPFPPALWALLWALMTDAKKDEWIERLSGQRRPASGLIEQDFGDHDVFPPPMIWGPGITHYGGW